MSLRCLIVDDEAPARERLRRMLAAFDDVDIVGEAGDGLSALEQVSALSPDLILLDIDMPELDGLGVAGALRAPSPAVVFVTAYDEHALKAFELAAVDYLLKPVSAERLSNALSRARSQRENVAASLTRAIELLRGSRSQRLAVRSGAKFIVVELRDVSAILASQHYAAVLAAGKELLSEQTLDELEARLDPTRFVRVHRAAIINLDYLRELVNDGDRRYYAQLRDPAGTRVPISRERLPTVKGLLGIG